MSERFQTTPAPPPALVMNMFYTGLGIARSLWTRGVPVIGLTAHRGVYGNFTRCARIVSCPDSRNEPKALRTFLLELGRTLERGCVIFPTRDDDLVFLDRFRADLEPYFSIVAPHGAVLAACLNKVDTSVAAERAHVPTPRYWAIEDAADLRAIEDEVVYPCVLKAQSAHHWRQGDNWERVGGRKAIEIESKAALRAEYDVIARAEKRALVQEMVPGGDDCLTIVACYLDRQSRWAAGFNTQKVLQIPEKFGTGCIVRSVSRPELFERTGRLLQTMGFSGVAEVEYKWDATAGDYKLIEINPRPWDQHRLGFAAGVDLIYLAYCDHAGLPAPALGSPAAGYTWIAEDTLVSASLRALYRGGPRPWTALRRTRGKKIYAIWWARDPMPSIAYWIGWFIPELLRAGLRAVWTTLRGGLFGRGKLQEGFRT